MSRHCRDGRCAQGRACPNRPIRTVEQEHPWLWLLYALSFIGAIVASAI